MHDSVSCGAHHHVMSEVLSASILSITSQVDAVSAFRSSSVLCLSRKHFEVHAAQLNESQLKRTGACYCKIWKDTFASDPSSYVGHRSPHVSRSGTNLYLASNEQAVFQSLALRGRASEHVREHVLQPISRMSHVSILPLV